jgi:hypothetical protein
MARTAARATRRPAAPAKGRTKPSRKPAPKATKPAPRAQPAARGRTAPSPRPAPAPKARPAERPVAETRTPVPSPTGETRGKYVYCVIESEKPLRFGPLGLGAEPSEVSTVHFRDLAAVVSDTPREVIDATRENILAHERVNEAVMHSHTVIPMSFGTVFKTREDIVELLKAAYEAFTDVLQKMRDKL